MILSRERRAALTTQANSHERNLHLAKDYLLDRGISMEAAEMFRLGYVNDGFFAHRLCIPYMTPGGVVALKFRCTRNHDCKLADCKKYLWPAGTGLHLFNAQVLIAAAEMVVLTEGELDAICVQAYTGIPAVGYPGVESWGAQKHYRLCFEGVQEVVVVADGDDVGRKAANRVAESIGIHARVVDLGDGEDANSFIATKGASAFAERISQ